MHIVLFLLLAILGLAAGMAYTSTQMQAGLGTILAINTGTPSTPTWTTIGEIKSIKQSGRVTKTDDATNLQTTGDEEFIGVIRTPGKYDVSVNRVTTDTGQAAVLSNFNSVPPVTVQFKATLLKAIGQVTTGDSYAFSAIIEECDDLETIEPTKGIQSKYGLKVSGTIVKTPGA
jgi:hypothetical protein